MSAHLWLSQEASAPTPGDIASYLLQAGWAFQATRNHWAEYAKDVAAEQVVLEVPQRSAAPDYPRAVSVLLEDIAHIEARAASAVLRDIKASSLDIIRLAMDGGATRDGRVAIEAGHRVYEAARDLLLAAACAVIDPRPAFAKRKPDEAMKLLTRAHFGQTEVGSFVLSMECSVPRRLQQTLDTNDGDPDAPLDRKASAGLARALCAAEGAARESAASGRIDPFRKHTKDGVSANLCEAVAELISATSAETLRASFSFASSRPVGILVPRAVTFSEDMVPTLLEAAVGLRDAATFSAMDVEGFVIKLGSAEASKGGDVVIHANIEGRSRSVHVHLEGAKYLDAIRAHKDRLIMRGVGDLGRDGQSWWLRNPREFVVVEPLEGV